MKDILERIDHNDGMTVPEGYFDDFAARMTASLPVMDWEKNGGKVMPRSMWQKLRPYIYLAAMFMGVWCMMKMFDMMRPASAGLAIEDNPVLTAAISNDYFIDDYFINDGVVDDYQLFNDLYEDGYKPVDYSGIENESNTLSDI